VLPQRVSGVDQAVELEVVLVVEEVARLEEELLEEAEDEEELVLAAAELEEEQDCQSTFVDVTVTKTVDIETVETIVVEAGKKALLKTVMRVQTAALLVTVDAGSVTVEALTVMVVGIHDDSIEVVVELNVTEPLEDVLDINVSSVVITSPVATQELALENLLGLLEQREAISGRPVESVLRVVV
jgi:hypothetical protein